MLLFSIYVFPIKRKKTLNNNYHSCVGSLISPLQFFFSLQKTSGYHAAIHLHNSLPHFKNTILFKRYNVFCVKIPTIDIFSHSSC